MPSFVKGKRQEKWWNLAKKAASKSKKYKSVDDLKDGDWALVNHIYQSISNAHEDFCISLGEPLLEAINPKHVEALKHDLAGVHGLKDLEEKEWESLVSYFEKNGASSILFAPGVFETFLEFSRNTGFPVTFGGADKGGMNTERYSTAQLLRVLVGADVLTIIERSASDAIDVKHSSAEDKEFREDLKQAVDVYYLDSEFTRALAPILRKLEVQIQQEGKTMPNDILGEAVRRMNRIREMAGRETIEDPEEKMGPESPEREGDFFKHLSDDTVEKFVDGILIVLGELQATGEIPNIEDANDARDAVLAAVRRMNQRRSLISRMARKFSRFGTKRILRKARADISHALS